MRSPKRTLMAAVLTAAGLFTMSMASAQAPSASPTPSTPGGSLANAPPPSDQKLDAAAAAIARVAFLRQNYERQLAQADPADREKIADQADTALTQAVKDQGLSVDEYNTIVDRAQKDPDVRRKLLARLHPPSDESGPTGGRSSTGK